MAGWPALRKVAVHVAELAALAVVAGCGSAAATNPSAGGSHGTIAASVAAPSSGASDDASPSPSASLLATPVATPEPEVVLVGAGDICRADYISKARATAAVVQGEIEAHPAAIVFTLGDNSNEQGTADQYTGCFDVTWGAFKSRIRPTIGNHDQYTLNGGPYYAYFGPAAGLFGRGYYSYDAGPYWHVVVLNAICSKAGGCGRGSAQEKWLQADLAASKGKHILAMWHVPEFSSGGHGSTSTYITWWRDLYAAGAEIVLSGHDHDYERFARQTPDGVKDPAGIRQFVAGTGGAAHSPILGVRANSETRSSLTYGILELTLKRDSYAWRFVPVAGGAFTDSGETPTHSQG
jgi:hypothetical protein